MFFQQFNYIHLKKSLYSKRCDLNKVILRAVSYIVFIRCRLIYNQHYAPYEHIYIYIYMCIYVYIYVIQNKSCQGNHCQLCTAFVSTSCVNSNGRTFHCRNQGTNCNTKWAVYVIMCDVCGMQYVGQTNYIRSRMNGHKSDYQRFLNGDFYKSDTSSLYSHLKSHDVKIFKFQILEILENESFKYTKDIRQLESSLDIKERHWIWKLETLTPQGLNVADTYCSENRSSRKKRSRYLCVGLYVYVCMCIHKLPSILLFQLFSFRSFLQSFYSALPALFIVLTHC